MRLPIRISSVVFVWLIVCMPALANGRVDARERESAREARNHRLGLRQRPERSRLPFQVHRQAVGDRLRDRACDRPGERIATPALERRNEDQRGGGGAGGLDGRSVVRRP